MKTRKLQLAMLVATQCAAMSASATLYDISFSDNPFNVSAIGSIGVTGTTADTGSITITDPNFPSIAGTYSLFLNPNAPSAAYSPSGYFIYDNQVYPGSVPFLDVDGLLFTGNGLEINLWGNGQDNTAYYTIYGNNGVAYNGTATIQAVVPEPTTMAAGCLLLLPFAASTIRILRKNRLA